MSSGSVYKRSRGDYSGSNDDGDVEEEERNEITDKRKKNRVFGQYRVGVSKSKKALLFQFRKFQKLFRRSLSSSSPASPSSVSRKDSRLFSRLCCCACFSKPKVVENDVSEGNLVPDDPEEYNYDYLKSFIEKNDFYSKECDTHFDD